MKIDMNFTPISLSTFFLIVSVTFLSGVLLFRRSRTIPIILGLVLMLTAFIGLMGGLVIAAQQARAHELKAFLQGSLFVKVEQAPPNVNSIVTILLERNDGEKKTMYFLHKTPNPATRALIEKPMGSSFTQEEVRRK